MRLFLIALLSSLVATAAVAKSVDKKVRANRASVIAAMSTFNEQNCNHGPTPRASIPLKPKHGKITIKKANRKAIDGKCKGKLMHFTVVYYTPKRGYRGADEVKVKFRYQKYINHPGDISYTTTYRLKVR